MKSKKIPGKRFKWYYILPVIFFIFFFIFLIVILSFFPKKKVDFSSYGTGPEGTKGAFMLLSELGFSVSRYEKSFDSLPAGLLLVIEPDYDLTGSEIFSLKQWLSGGNTLVFFSEYDNSLYKKWNMKMKESKSAGVFQPLYTAGPVSGVTDVKFTSLSRIDGFADGMVEYFGDGTGPLMVTCPEGKGHAVFITDNTLISNKSIGNLDNSVLLVSIVNSYAGKGSNIYFDEYHHGYGTVTYDRKETLRTWMPVYMKVILLQVFLAIFICLFARSLRFGLPVPLSAKPSCPCQAEFVTSMANLFIRAEGRREIAGELYSSFKRDIVKKLAIKNQDDYNEIAKKVSERTGLPSGPLAELIKSASSESGTMSEKELFNWYKEIKKYRKGFFSDQ